MNKLKQQVLSEDALKNHRQMTISKSYPIIKNRYSEWVCSLLRTQSFDLLSTCGSNPYWKWATLKWYYQKGLRVFKLPLDLKKELPWIKELYEIPSRSGRLWSHWISNILLTPSKFDRSETKVQRAFDWLDNWSSTDCTSLHCKFIHAYFIYRVPNWERNKE